MYFNEQTLELGPFLFFGSEAGKSLPDISNLKIAKHTKANAKGEKNERPQIRVVNKGQFTRYEKIEDIYKILFKGA